MMPKRDFLFDFKEFNGGMVLLGDNRACSIMGTGKVRVQMKDDSSFVLENVRYIPELKRNLISLGTLDREGYTVKLQNGRVKVIKGSLMVLSGTMKENCVYSLDGWAESGKASVGIQEKESLAQVWHKCLGHISEAGLRELKKKVLRNKGLGPSQVESMSGCRYFLSIVDDYSRRVWVHFLRHTNEAFNKFKEWKQLVENQTGRKLKKLQTDNGLEFCNQEFNNLCKESGIARHLTVSGLPDSFWAEATVTAAYLINRSPSTALEKKTPMKLKPRAIKCIFLGYSEGVKGYRLWRLDDVKPKIIISKDVVFNESLMYKDTLKGVGVVDSGKEVEFEVELQGSRVEPTVDPHTGKIQVMKIRSKMKGLKNRIWTTMFWVKYDMAAYAFVIAEEEDTHEPITFQEAINSSKKDEWVHAIEEKMSSLKKNHTWELVDQPPGQKLVSCKWLYKIKERIEGVQKPRSVVVNYDNQSAIHLLRNAMFHERMKHINVRYHFIREIVESKEIEVAKIGTKDNVVDAFTKVLTNLYVTLAEKLHRLAVQLVADGSGAESVNITYTSSRATIDLDTLLYPSLGDKIAREGERWGPHLTKVGALEVDVRLDGHILLCQQVDEPNTISSVTKTEQRGFEEALRDPAIEEFVFLALSS
ncbi:retrovirus-related pol polyprotein from transposon TNT 1-94 [Tanacetum coccineum]|uniref:Retrovirus-related pol polyprotein from transposon TNT 1-94 n=1 Tax=Tanacetum coccineum TaxID=301880 RepID=A0ABQ4ZMN0_9ASTR